jgi:SAM-dependent methyltransferase
VPDASPGNRFAARPLKLFSQLVYRRAVSSLYTTHASWFHLLTAPTEYAGEAAWLRERFVARGIAGGRMLELGSGGGNMASHLREHYELTLTDLSPEMLALSATLNPELDHVAGDMRTLRLDAAPFDAVLIHDAVDYMMTAADLHAAFDTAYVHLRPGGVVIIQPDHVAETFEPNIETGGYDDAGGRGLRYLEWTHPATDAGVRTDFACLLRHPDGTVELVHDVHRYGLFPEALWRDTLIAVGFSNVEVVVDDWDRECFIGRRP